MRPFHACQAAKGKSEKKGKQNRKEKREDRHGDHKRRRTGGGSAAGEPEAKSKPSRNAPLTLGGPPGLDYEESAPGKEPSRGQAPKDLAKRQKTGKNRE